MRKVTTCLMAVFFAMAVVACELTPQQPGEAVAFGYLTHKALTRSVTDAVKAEVITTDQGQQAAEALREAAGQLRIAKQAVAAGDPASGDALARALSYLRIVEAILAQGSEA